MAQAISEAKVGGQKVAIRVGKQVIDILTTGMYSNPLMVLREYIQNSVDAIDAAVGARQMAHGAGTVIVTLDGAARSLQVADNGTGVPHDEVVSTLCSLGCSAKDAKRSRGFRGIGRLGGIGYSDHLQFETRSNASERVATVEWDCRTLRQILIQKTRTPIEEALQNSVTVTYRRGGPNDPKRFMRVIMSGIQPFHRDELMSPPAVASYLGQVAPVPFDKESFRWGADVNKHIQNVPGYATYKVILNGHQVFRPHTTRFEVSAGQADTIQDIETFEVHGHDGQSLGRGWYAKTSCLASIPPRVKMRGIRVRQGNIEVGGEYFLEEAFAERRFATWHIGEIHVDHRLKTNARRDGFEQSPDYEAFLEQAASLGKHLSQECRSASKQRSGQISVERALCGLESATARNLFVDEAHLETKWAEIMAVLKRLNTARKAGSLDSSKGKRLYRCEMRLAAMLKNPCFLRDAIDCRTIQHMSRTDLLTVLAGALLNHDKGRGDREGLLRTVLAPYLKPRYSH
jgi:molecular chaperone HtpG